MAVLGAGLASGLLVRLARLSSSWLARPVPMLPEPTILEKLVGYVIYKPIWYRERNIIVAAQRWRGGILVGVSPDKQSRLAQKGWHQNMVQCLRVKI